METLSHRAGEEKGWWAVPTLQLAISCSQSERVKRAPTGRSLRILTDSLMRCVGHLEGVVADAIS